MPIDVALEQEVRAALDALFDHFANARLEETLAAFASDPDVALYGSEVGEVAIGQDALRRFFERFYAQRSGPHFKLLECRISTSGGLAWFVASAEITIGTQVFAPYRLTGVLEKREGRWLWRLFSGAEPLPDRL